MTTKTKNTPGPWVYEYGMVTHPEKGALLHADRTNPETRPIERDANARLASAAPDLLAVAEAFERWFASHVPANGDEGKRLYTIHTYMRAAIAKAEGEEG
jgi:hypothetical protein